MLIALHIRHLDVHRLLQALRQSKCSFGCPATEPLGAALALALMRRNACDPAALQIHNISARLLRCMPMHVTFPALETILSGLEGDSQAYTTGSPTRFSLVLRQTMSHVVISSVGVKHISGTSGESRVVSGPSPGYPHVWSMQVWPMSPRVCAGADPSNNAKGSDAEFQELAKAGMIAQARSESAKSSVSLGFSMARADNLWACDGWAPPCSTAPGSVVCDFFGGGVIGVFPVAALRALALSLPPAAARCVLLFEVSHLLRLVFVQVPELGFLFGDQPGIQSCTTFLRQNNRRSGEFATTPGLRGPGCLVVVLRPGSTCFR